LLWIAANIVEPPEGAPPLAGHFADAVLVWLDSPFLMALKTTSAVISFSMLEGAQLVGVLLNNTLPLASIRIAVGASPATALDLLLGALHAVVGGVDCRPTDRHGPRPASGRATSVRRGPGVAGG
jgi:hypothetical protein